MGIHHHHFPLSVMFYAYDRGLYGGPQSEAVHFPLLPYPLDIPKGIEFIYEFPPREYLTEVEFSSILAHDHRVKNNLSIFGIFAAPFWISMGVAFAILPILSYWIRVARHYCRSRKFRLIEAWRSLDEISHEFFRYLCLSLGEAYPFPARSSKWLIGTWALFCVIFTGCFGGEMRDQMSRKERIVYAETLDDLIDTPPYNEYQVYQGSPIEVLIFEWTDIRAIKELLETDRIVILDPLKFYNFDIESTLKELDELKRGDHVMLSPSLMSEYYLYLAARHSLQNGVPFTYRDLHISPGLYKMPIVLPCTWRAPPGVCSTLYRV